VIRSSKTPWLFAIYDLRMSNIRVHLDLAADLPVTAADPYQLQQVFLNLVNNAVDAILEQSKTVTLVRTGTNGDRIFIDSQTVVPACRMLPGYSIPFTRQNPLARERGWD